MSPTATFEIDALVAHALNHVVNVRSVATDYVYVGRGRAGQPSDFGNPVRIAENKTRFEAVSDFEMYLLFSNDLPAVRMRQLLHTLRGRRLGCFCSPQLCHGHVLAGHAASLTDNGCLPVGGLLGWRVAPEVARRLQRLNSPEKPERQGSLF